jgi:TIR domain-containing protein/F5/8 type C domain-containing protein
MKRIVFISHSSEDKGVADGICAFLEGNGVACWIAPRDVTPGKNYGAAILDAIDECRVFVLVLSSHSNKSNQVVREVERAASSDSIIVPFRVENVQPSRNIAFYVSAAHWLDASEKPVEDHFAELLTAIRDWQKNEDVPGRVQPPPLPSPTPPALPRFPVFALVIAAVVGALLIWFGLFYRISHRGQNQTGQSTPSAENASPAKSTSSVTPEPSSTIATGVASTPETTPLENASPSPTAPSATANPQRLRPGQHLTSPVPGPSISATAPANAPVVREVAASSYIDNDYRPNLAFDGNPSTEWVPKGKGPEQSLIVNFKSPVLIHSVSILNGDGRDEEHYRASNRVRTLRLILSNGETQILTFEDALKMQRFELTSAAKVNWIKFEIVSVFRGSNNSRAGISEIGFNEDAL